MKTKQLIFISAFAYLAYTVYKSQKAKQVTGGGASATGQSIMTTI
jgi:hypothetical protein